MPESPTGQDRTEPATDRKRRQARERGQVPKSMEVTTVCILLAGLIYFRAAGGLLIQETNRFLVGTVQRIQSATLDPVEIVQHTVAMLLLLLGPFFLVVVVVALAANVLQVGFLFASDPITPKWERINPAEGFQRIFSKRGLNELGKSLLKIALIGVVTWYSLKPEMDVIVRLVDAMGVGQILLTLSVVSFKVLLRATLVLVVLAVIDYAVQRHIYESGLRMTRKEVEEELRETEGDPLIRARFRQIREQRARQRMLAEVPSADVVITNPTEIAVALRYDAARDDAPVVVAKGRGYVAQRIRQVAQEHGIAVYEDRALAQVLFKSVEIGSYIPGEFYVALAEILAYLHRSGRLRRRVA